MINNPWNFDYNLDREEQRVDIIFTEGIVEVVLQRDSLVAPFYSVESSSPILTVSGFVQRNFFL